MALTEGDPFLEAARRVRAGPLRAYRKGREEGLLRKDGRQEATALALQRLYDDLVAAHPPATPAHSSGLTMLDAAPPPEAAAAGRTPWWKGLFSGDKEGGSGGGETRRVQGLYMHGGVGVGKTMLMDLLAATAPLEFKVSPQAAMRMARLHFGRLPCGLTTSSCRAKCHTIPPVVSSTPLGMFGGKPIDRPGASARPVGSSPPVPLPAPCSWSAPTFTTSCWACTPPSAATSTPRTL